MPTTPVVASRGCDAGIANRADIRRGLSMMAAEA